MSPGIIEKAKDKVVDAAEATKHGMENVKDKVIGKKQDNVQEFHQSEISGTHGIERSDNRGVMDKARDNILDTTYRGADKVQQGAEKLENKAIRSKKHEQCRNNCGPECTYSEEITRERCGPNCATENMHFAGNTAAGGYTSSTHHAKMGPSF